MKHVVILNDTRNHRHHGSNGVMRALERLLTRSGFVVVGTVVCNELFSIDLCRTVFDRADLILINGEGTFHGYATYASFLAMQVLALREIYPRKPIVFINTMIEEPSNIVLEAIDSATYVFTRDRASADLINNASVVSQDVDLLALELLENSGVGVGMDTPLPPVLIDSVNSDIQASIWKGAFAGAVSLSVHETNWSTAALKEVRNLLTQNAVIGRHLREFSAQCSFWQFVHTIARSELVISGRFHANVVALFYGAPLVSLSTNSAKSMRLFKENSYDGPAIRWEEVDSWLNRRDEKEYQRLLGDAADAGARVREKAAVCSRRLLLYLSELA